MMKRLAYIALLACPGLIYAIGGFQLGVSLGLAPNVNNIARAHQIDSGDTANGTQNSTLRSRRDSVEYYDNLIKEAIEERGAKGGTVGYPFGFTGGVDARYIWNSVFFRLAADYAGTTFGRRGSLTTTNYNDTIEYNSWHAMFPVSIGLSHGVTEFFHFYFGIGPYYAYSHIKVKHSDPKAFTETALGKDTATLSNSSGFIPYKSQTIEGGVVGFHILVGVQVPIIPRRLYVSVDYLHYEGRSAALKITGTDSSNATIEDTVGDTIIHDSDKYMVGVQYWINMR